MILFSSCPPGERFDPSIFPDESRTSVDETVTFIYESRSSVDETSTLVDESLTSIDEFLTFLHLPDTPDCVVAAEEVTSRGQRTGGKQIRTSTAQ